MLLDAKMAIKIPNYLNIMKKINKHLHSQIVHQKTRKKTQRVQKENEMHIRIKTMYRTHSLTQLIDHFNICTKYNP
jgi:hypothetical protein